jgi:hypothetical protein
MLNDRNDNPTYLILEHIYVPIKEQRRGIPNDFKHKNTYSVLDFAGEDVANPEGPRNLYYHDWNIENNAMQRFQLLPKFVCFKSTFF